MSEATAKPVGYRIVAGGGVTAVGKTAGNFSQFSTGLVVGENPGPWAGLPGNTAGPVRWWNTPDLDLRYVIARVINGTSQPVPVGVATGASVAFWATSAQIGARTQANFLSLTNYVYRQVNGPGPPQFGLGPGFPQPADDAQPWIESIGMWTNYPAPPTPGPGPEP